MIIYVIYHKDFENTNVFTTKEDKINDIILELMKTTETEYDEWKYREIEEGTWFTADFSSF